LTNNHANRAARRTRDGIPGGTNDGIPEHSWAKAIELTRQHGLWSTAQAPEECGSWARTLGTAAHLLTGDDNVTPGASRKMKVRLHMVPITIHVGLRSICFAGSLLSRQRRIIAPAFAFLPMLFGFGVVCCVVSATSLARLLVTDRVRSRPTGVLQLRVGVSSEPSKALPSGPWASTKEIGDRLRSQRLCSSRSLRMAACPLRFAHSRGVAGSPA
jgi:hypothetical protein